MALDPTRTLALMQELRRFHDRGCVADAELVYEALRPSLELLEQPETWAGDEAQTYEAFAHLAWMAGESDPKPFGVAMPEWLATWAVTTHRPLPAPARASFDRRLRRADAAPSGAEPPATAASERDPLEVAVIGVILAGASLILALETKVKARTAAESKAAAERASGANRIRLRAIRRHLDELHRHLGSLRELGSLVLDPTKTGLTRTSIVFASAEAEEQFNQDFDRVTALIGRINRALSEIDPRGLPLSDDDVRRYVDGPVVVAEARLGALLRPEVGPNERIDKAAELVAGYSALVDDLASALDTGP